MRRLHRGRRDDQIIGGPDGRWAGILRKNDRCAGLAILHQRHIRNRPDAQGTVQVLIAAGVHDLYVGKTATATAHFEKAVAIADAAGIQNAYTLPAITWLACASPFPPP